MKTVTFMKNQAVSDLESIVIAPKKPPADMLLRYTQSLENEQTTKKFLFQALL